MDLWDLAKVLLRRWIVAVPLLVLTVGATAWTAATIEPDYSAVGNMTLLPPTVERPANPDEARTVNPWDTFQMAGVALIHANSKTLKDQFEAQGFDGDWEATADARYGTVITVEVTAGSEQEARDTMREVLTIIANDVEARQDEYDLPADQRITTVIFEEVFDIAAVTGKVKRAMVVVLGIGMILTVAVTVTVDALLRRRARSTAPPTGSASGVHSVPPKPLVTGALSQPIRVRVMSPPTSATGEGPSTTDAVDDPKPVRARAAVVIPADSSPPSGIDRAEAPSEPEDRTTDNGHSQRSHSTDDSTVVLPLSEINISSRDLPRAGPGNDGHPR